MENNSPIAVAEQFLRENHLSMQRDSWSEEIDPLRSNNESDIWSKSRNDFYRESPHILAEESNPLDGDPLERDSLSEDDDQLMKPNGDALTAHANGDAVDSGKGRDLMARPHPIRGGNEREHIMKQDYALHYEGGNLSLEKAYPARAGYERDHEPMKGYDRLSVERAHTMKDFEKQITELKKENFNLKLRIYFLEEQVQRHCDNSSEELQRMNIELKVEVESLKHEYQEKQNLLIRASKAMESLGGTHNSSIQQMKEDHLKQLHDFQEAGQKKIHLLEEELKQEKAELKKVCVLLEQERMQRFSAEERLLAVKEQYNKSMGMLEERDWIIQCLNETLRSKDALITQLEKQINTMIPSGASATSPTTNVDLLPESDLKECRPQSPGLTCRDCLATKSSEEKEENVYEWKKKVKEMENVINGLQQKLEDSKAEFANEEKNSVKRDKAIQGLTIALKKKTKENEKLVKEIENLNAALRETREAALRDQSFQKSSDPDYKKLVLTIQTQQDLCSRLHEYERESGSLQKEIDAIVLLRKWLEKDIQSNQELRKILEAQIMMKYRESDTMSFIGDQTSYLSICLDHLGENNNNIIDERVEVKSVETQTELTDSSMTEEHTSSLLENKLEQFVIEKVSEEEIPAAVAKHPKHEFTGLVQTRVSSSTQTVPKLCADKSILVDNFAFENETSDLKNGANEILGDLKSHHVMSEVGKSCHEIHNDKQQKCFSNNLTKSRIPVLLKSPLSRRPRTDVCLTFRENEHTCLEKELQEENRRLLEQLNCAKLEIGALKSDKENPNCIPQGWDIFDHAGIETSQADLKPERLKCAQIQMEDAQKSTKSPDADMPEKEKRDSLQQTLHQELQLGNYKLPEELKLQCLKKDNSPSIEVTSENTRPVLDDVNVAERDLSTQSLHTELQPERDLSTQSLHTELQPERDLSTQSLHTELQLENFKLAEQLKCAQMDIEKLKSTQIDTEKLQPKEVNLENKNALSDLDSTSDLAVRSLIKELQLENQKLVEQLKYAQVEIEKLREEKVSEDIDGSFRLDNLDVEDRESEHSFLDKTITNTLSLHEIHNGNPDIEVQVNSHNFTCQNISGLCCHHDRFCIECANNQETLIVQSSSFKKVSTIQKECKLLTVSHSHRQFEDTSLSKYDLLVQSQARELSYQRQKIKESHNLSVVCSKNFINVIKAFEDLLSTTNVDSNIALGFQEQLAQTVEWLKELEYKLSDAYYGEDDANSDHSADSLLYTPSRLVPGHKMWADKRGCHVLGLVEDYNALRKQILEAKTVLEETEAFIDHGVQTAVLNMTEPFGNVFFEKLNRSKQSLEEANCLLKLLWRVSLPLQTHSSYNIRQVEEANLEMTRLRKRVLEQEKLLSGMVKRVYSENQIKEDIEKVIMNQLAMTHEILKRAKGNLEVQVVDKR